MSDRGGGLTRDVILRISAQNLSTADFRAATNAVNELTAAVDKQIQAAAKGTVKEAELTASLSKLNDVSKNLQGFAKIIENLKGLDVQITAQIQKIADAKKAWEDQQATMAATANVTQRMKDRLAGLENGYKAAEKTLNDQIARQQAYRNTLQQNGLDVQNLANAERQLLAVADQAGLVVNKLTQARDNYARILRETREEEQRTAAAAKAAAEAEAARVTQIRAAIAAIEAAKQAEQARRLADVQAGAQQIANRAETERRIQKEIEEGARKAAAEQRAIRMATVQAEVEANAKRREEANKTERAIAADRARAAAEVAEGARRGTPVSQERMNEIRRDIEERLRLRQIDIRSEIEDERRRSIGVTGRMREDMALRRQLRRQEAEEQRNERQRTGSTATRSFLGLQPYEITNLGYQATDVFQGALSGVGLGTIAAQQGPQIFQIFGLAALKWSPIIVTALGAITVAVGALQRTFREQAAERTFGGLLAANEQSINYNKQQLVDLGKAARDMGISWKDGIDAIKTAMSGNIAQDRIKTLLQAAQDVEDVTGTKVPDAMKQFVEALSGSGEELLKLGAEYRLFGREEEAYIRRQVNAGNVEEARRFTIERLSKVMRERAEEALGPWTRALREVSKAWDDFLLSFAKTEEFKALNNMLLGLVETLGKLALKLDELSKKGGIGHALLGALVGPNSVVVRAINEVKAALGQPPVSFSGTAFAEEAATAYGKGVAPETNPNLSANQKTVATWLSSHGYSPAQAAAIMGNVSAESSFDPAITNATGHFGLFQWDKNRQAALGNPPSTDIIKQLELMDKELQQLDPTFKQSTDNFVELTKRFRDTFERPIPKDKIGTAFDTADLNKRAVEAARFYQKPGAALPAPTTRSDTAAGEPKPVQTGPTPAQRDEGEKALQQDKERYEIAQAISVEEEKQKEFARIEREIRQSNKDPVSAAGEIRIKQLEIENKLREEQRVREARLADEAVTQAKHITEIRAAGEKAVAEARAQGIAGYRELERIENEAKTREANRLNRIDQEKDRYQGIVTAIDNVKRSLDGAYGPDVEARIDAVRLKYKDLGEQIRRTLRENTLTDKAPLEAQLQRLPALQEREEFVARGKAYEDQAKAAWRRATT